MDRYQMIDPLPLISFVTNQFEPKNLRVTAELLNVSYRQLCRYLYEGQRCHVFQADRMAVSIGRHPAEIWDDWYAPRELVT